MDWYEPEATTPEREKDLMRRNWVRWVFLILAALFYTWFYGGFLSFTLLFITLLMPVVSLAALIGNYFFFKIGENLNERIFIKGDCARYRLLLGNEGFIPIPYLTVTMYLEGRILCDDMKSMQISLAPFAKKEFIYEMPLHFRGRYSIGVRSILFRDFLGLFAVRHRPLERKSILVKPRIRLIAHKKIPAAMVSEGNVLAGLYESGNDEMVDIRAYVPGDSLRKMHWKLTAKTGNPMVRDMRNELDNDILLLLDVGMAAEQNERTLLQEDCLIEEAVSQSQYLLAHGMPARICFWREEPVVLRTATPGDFLKAYELLSEVKFNQESHFEDVIDNFLDPGTHRSLVYLFTVRLTHGIIEKAIAMRHRGFDTEIFYIIAPDTDAATGRNTAGSLHEQMARNSIRIHRLVTEQPIQTRSVAKASA